MGMHDSHCSFMQFLDTIITDELSQMFSKVSTSYKCGNLIKSVHQKELVTNSLDLLTHPQKPWWSFLYRINGGQHGNGSSSRSCEGGTGFVVGSSSLTVKEAKPHLGQWKLGKGIEILFSFSVVRWFWRWRCATTGYTINAYVTAETQIWRWGTLGREVRWLQLNDGALDDYLQSKLNQT